MFEATNLKRGALIEMDAAPWQVVEVSFQTPSARGAQMIVKAKLRNLKTSAVLTKSFRGSDMLQEADCERRQVQYLYRQQDALVFMDLENFEQFELSGDILGDAPGYLLDGMQVGATLYNGEVMGLDLPNAVELEVIETAPAMKNATAQAQLKPATLETGLQIQVPAYLTTGEVVRVDTRDGRFLERAKKSS